jgi:hypothetical protein
VRKEAFEYAARKNYTDKHDAGKLLNRVCRCHVPDTPTKTLHVVTSRIVV